MAEDTNDVRRAAARIAGLHAYGKTPDPEAAAAAYRTLATARLDREIRQLYGVADALAPVQAAHVVGLLMAWGGSDEDRIERLTRVVTEAVACTPRTTDADRMALAQLVLGGGGK